MHVRLLHNPHAGAWPPGESVHVIHTISKVYITHRMEKKLSDFPFFCSFVCDVKYLGQPAENMHIAT